ncbi:MAG TPA: M56 family metallopeptidase [Candidatus Elarobacter sp.]|jgi:TonB family protein|nr:M56 family metallopeptidase [Candidatus Elarobacter sp.]
MSGFVQQLILATAAVALNALWQSMLIAGAIWLVLRSLRGIGASTRYAVWLCALVAMLAVPVATVVLSAQQPSAPSENVSASANALRQDRAPFRPRVTTAAHDEAPAAYDGTPDGPDTAASTPNRISVAIPETGAAVIALLWLLAVGARLVKLGLAMSELGVIRRGATPFSNAHEYPVLLSQRVSVPVAFGFARPVVVLPAALPGEIGADELRTVVVHESAHLRRLDVWTNALARIIEALLAPSPAVWFVMRRLGAEREIACDDCVVARTGLGDAFANVLAGFATRIGANAPIAAAGATGSSRSAIVARIERLLDASPRHLRLSPSALAAALGSLAVLALVAESVSPVLAFASQPAVLGHVAQPPAPVAGPIFAPVVSRAACAGTSFTPVSAIPVAALLTPSAAIAKFGASRVVTFDLDFDAAGKARSATITSTPYPSAGRAVRYRLTMNRFRWIGHDCKPPSGTLHGAVVLRAPRPSSISIVEPVYPKGWSAAHAGSCKVPSLLHTGMPAFPPGVTVPVDTQYTSSVRVHVDAAGAVSGASVVGSSGRPAFDDAVLAAARRPTYPLTEATRFKPVRPSGTTLAWNAAHGSSTYARCAPLPADYLWRTTFSRSTGLVLATRYLVQRGGDFTWR